MEFRHVVEEPEVLFGRNHAVTLGDEPRAHVAHEDGRAARFLRDADETMIDRRGHSGEQSRSPNEEGTAADVAGRAHDPIVLDADVLHDEARAADDDAFHWHARLAVAGRKRLSCRRAGQQLIDRLGDWPAFARPHSCSRSPYYAWDCSTPQAVASSAIESDLTFALELADAADETTMPRFRARDLVVETKPDLTPVTEADRAAENMLRARIEAEHPGDGVVGEEYGETAGSGGRRWILDPIDGTKSYVRGIPAWGTLIALEREGEIVVGVVSAPALPLLLPARPAPPAVHWGP